MNRIHTLQHTLQHTQTLQHTLQHTHINSHPANRRNHEKIKTQQNQSVLSLVTVVGLFQNGRTRPKKFQKKKT